MTGARMDSRQQRRREGALMGRDRLAGFLTRARVSMTGDAESLRLGADLLAAGFTEADICGVCTPTPYEGGGWHGKVTVAVSLETGGGNRPRTRAVSPRAKEAEAGSAAVGFLAALLAVATNFGSMRTDQRRRLTLATEAVLAAWTGDRAAAAALTLDEVEDTAPIAAERGGRA